MTSMPGLKHLVLLGAGHAHVHVLHALARQRQAELRLTVIAPYTRQMYSGMLPGLVAGHYRLEQCGIPLENLVRRSGARHIQASGTAIDANARTVTLSNGCTMAFDWLSLNTGPVMDRDLLDRQMPGAREHALFLRPIETFAHLWPRVAALAHGRALRIAVIGAGAAGVELALAIDHALRQSPCQPGSRVTLVTGGATPAAHYPPGTRRRLGHALKQRGITVLPDLCVGITASEVLLASGARLACDAPVLAVGAQAPRWLAGSGLALDDAGFVAVNAFQQSTSHDHVFAAGDVSSRVDPPHPRSGVYAVRAGPPLLANLRAALAGRPLTAYTPQKRTLNLLACGDRRAIGSWGRFSAEGAWVWRWKDHIDRRFIQTYSA